MSRPDENKNEHPVVHPIPEQKRLLLFHGLRHLFPAHGCRHFPETVLRMAVKKSGLPGFYGRKTAENQNPGIVKEVKETPRGFYTVVEFDEDEPT